VEGSSKLTENRWQRVLRSLLYGHGVDRNVKAKARLGLAIVAFAGIFAVKAFKRFKNGALEGVLLHLCYWAGVMSLNEIYDDSSKRDFYL